MVFARLELSILREAVGSSVGIHMQLYVNSSSMTLIAGSKYDLILGPMAPYDLDELMNTVIREYLQIIPDDVIWGGKNHSHPSLIQISFLPLQKKKKSAFAFFFLWRQNTF